MPELPEVEAARKSLGRTVIGKTVLAVDVHTRPAIRSHSPEALAKIVVGKRLARVERRGKMLLFHFSGGWVLTFHFKLWGLLRFHKTGAAGDSQTAAVVRFRDGTALEFRELQLSSIELYRSDELHKSAYVSSLGIDPLSREFSKAALQKMLVARGNVRAILTDQTRIAGIGNLWAHEILHAARLRPDRQAASLSPSETNYLYNAVKHVLREGITRGGEPEFEDALGRKGRYPLAVYGRTGQPCPRRDGKVRSTRLGGRPSFYCPGCQH